MNQSNNKNKRIEDVPISELLLQKPPFVMVDRLTFFSEHEAETEFEVRVDNVFCVDGHLQLGGLVENIAQCNAARIGYYYRYVLGKSVQMGFIGAIRSLTIYCLPSVGEVLKTRIKLVSEAFGMSSIEARIEGSVSGLCAEGQMTNALAE